MQVAVWVILFASVFPQRKTQHRHNTGEKSERAKKTKQRTKKYKEHRMQKSDEETTNEKHKKKGDEMELVRLVKYSRKQVPQCSCDVRLRSSHVLQRMTLHKRGMDEDTRRSSMAGNREKTMRKSLKRNTFGWKGRRGDVKGATIDCTKTCQAVCKSQTTKSMDRSIWNPENSMPTHHRINIK